MIAHCDWVVPRLNGVRYFEKPVLGYWVHAASLLLFGENNFAVRFPSALAVGLSTLLLLGMARWILRSSFAPDDFPAALAALVYLSSIEVFGVGNIGVLDSLFAFLVTASICAFYGACEAPRASAREKAFLALAEAYLSLSLALYNEGRYQDSIQAGTKALEVKPDYAPAYNNICAAYNALGQYEKAAACEKGIQIAPDMPIPKNNLALAKNGLKPLSP